MTQEKIHYLKKPRGKESQFGASEYAQGSFKVICLILMNSFLSRTKALAGIRKSPHRQPKFPGNTHTYLKITHCKYTH